MNYNFFSGNCKMKTNLNSTLAHCISIASEAHKDQVDKIGEPYILHPLRVMLSMQSVYDRMTAVLHDVIEDTPLTAEHLLSMDVPQRVVQAVIAMSKLPDEGYTVYLMRVLDNEIARRVKIADVKDNSSPIRLYKLTPDKIEKLTIKYAKALRILEGWS